MRSDVIMATVMVQARGSHVVRREFSVVVRVRVLGRALGDRIARGRGLRTRQHRGPRRWHVVSASAIGVLGATGRTGVGQRSGCAGVLVEESAEEVDSFDRSLRSTSLATDTGTSRPVPRCGRPVL
jgi:hypothetical protein